MLDGGTDELTPVAVAAVVVDEVDEDGVELVSG